MKCKKYKLLISLFLDNELTVPQQSGLNTHLKKCMRCTQYLQDLQTVRSLISKPELIDVPVDVSRNLKLKIINVPFPENTGIILPARAWGWRTITLSILIFLAIQYFFPVKIDKEIDVNLFKPISKLNVASGFTPDGLFKVNVHQKGFSGKTSITHWDTKANNNVEPSARTTNSGRQFFASLQKIKQDVKVKKMVNPQVGIVGTEKTELREKQVNFKITDSLSNVQKSLSDQVKVDYPKSVDTEQIVKNNGTIDSSLPQVYLQPEVERQTVDVNSSVNNIVSNLTIPITVDNIPSGKEVTVNIPGSEKQQQPGSVRLAPQSSGKSLTSGFKFDKIAPNPFTPNGDGINDEVNFYFEKPAESVVTIKIFDLSGTLIRDLDTSIQPRPFWDGKNQTGEVVEGGLYIFQIKVDTEITKGVVILAK